MFVTFWHIRSYPQLKKYSYDVLHDRKYLCQGLLVDWDVFANSVGKRGKLMKICLYNSILGEYTLAQSEKGLCGIWLQGQKHEFGAWNNEPKILEDTPLFKRVKQWLDAYFDGQNREIDFPLDLKGTPFQIQVWSILLTIPYGETITYKEIAKRISPTMSCQAVGQAVGHNPISIVVPCHRVIATSGQLTGYAGGIEVKKWLLKHEGVLK